MVFRPDLGLHLQGLGGADRQYTWPDIQVDELAILKDGTVTFATTVRHSGLLFAASFEVSRKLLLASVNELFERAPQGLAARVAAAVAKPDKLSTLLPLPAFMVGLRTRLGQPGVGLHGQFIPLVVEEVLVRADFASKLQPGGLFVEIDRAQVERRDVEPALAVLELCIRDRRAILRYMDRVQISFRGYTSDPREIWEIPEIRQYMAALTARFPYWLWFVPKDTELLMVLLVCLSPVHPVMGKGLEYDDKQWTELLWQLSGSVERLLSEHGIPDIAFLRHWAQFERYYRLHGR